MYSIEFTFCSTYRTYCTAYSVQSSVQFLVLNEKYYSVNYIIEKDRIVQLNVDPVMYITVSSVSCLLYSTYCTAYGMQSSVLCSGTSEKSYSVENNTNEKYTIEQFSVDPLREPNKKYKHFPKEGVNK